MPFQLTSSASVLAPTYHRCISHADVHTRKSRAGKLRTRNAPIGISIDEANPLFRRFSNHIVCLTVRSFDGFDRLITRPLTGKQLLVLERLQKKIELMDYNRLGIKNGTVIRNGNGNVNANANEISARCYWSGRGRLFSGLLISRLLCFRQIMLLCGKSAGEYVSIKCRSGLCSPCCLSVSTRIYILHATIDTICSRINGEFFYFIVTQFEWLTRDISTPQNTLLNSYMF